MSSDKSLSFGATAAIYSCFVLSGFSALLYQAVWIRKFAVVFGTSHISVAIVLAAYMAGLAAGALVIERNASRVRSPLRLYAALELGIALYAVAFAPLTNIAARLLPVLAGVDSTGPQSVGMGQQAYYLVASLLVLGPPTVVMGMTLPILARVVVRTDGQIGPRVANLYASNTLGAVLGTIAAGFLLLPSIGLSQTLLIGALGNVVAAGVAWRLAQSRVQYANAGPAVCSKPSVMHRLVLAAMFVSGAVSFYYELLWTRLLAHVLGGTTYAYATMLAAFLSGIALGSALGGRFAKSQNIALSTLAATQLSVGLASAATYYWLQEHTFVAVGLSTNALAAFAVIVPSTIFIGATYPLAVRTIATKADAITADSARVYAWNTCGAIVGATAAGFWVIPSLGFAVSLKYAVFVNTTLAIILAIRRYHWAPALAAGGAFLALLTVALNPQRPQSLIESAAVVEDRPGREVFFGVGKSATVYVKQVDGYYYVRSDGRPEATVPPLGAPPSRLNQYWLGALAAAARPDAASALVVGLGGGVAVNGLPTSVTTIDIVEIEAQVVEANRAIAAQRASDPLRDDRVNVIVNDARSALVLTDRQYDLIISQPSHPWTAGASHLYTLEFAQLARSRLTNDGLFLQWINAQFIDEDLLRSTAATLRTVYPFVELYQVEPMVMMFLASEAPIAPQTTVVDLLASPDARRLQRIGMNSPEALLATWHLDKDNVDALAADQPVITDDRNRMAYNSRADGAGLLPRELEELLRPYDPLLKAVAKSRSAADARRFVHVAQLLMGMGYDDRVAAMVLASSDPYLQAMIRGVALHARGARAESAFLEALSHRPADPNASFGLIRGYAGELATGSNVPIAISSAAEALRGSARAVLEGWRHSSRGDRVALAELDDVLASSERQDLWYSESVVLRCDLRLARFQTSPDSVHLRQVVEIADANLATDPSIDLYLRRAAALLLLEDRQGYVETVAAAVTNLEERARLVAARTGDQPSTFQRDVARVENAVGRIPSSEETGSARPDELVRRWRQLRNRLQ